MPSFEWNEHFITGIESVDLQHKHLVDTINEYARKLSQNDVKSEELEQLFNELVHYAQYHFDEEERELALSKIDSRHTEVHLAAHQRFLENVITQKSNIVSSDVRGQHELLSYLVDWLVFHILGTDRNMARQLKAIKAGLTPEQAYETQEREADAAISPLLTSLERLYQQVALRNHELLVLNHSLESRIEARTRELSEANNHLEQIALTDPLTGLPNRRHAVNSLTKLWSESRQSNSSLVCMMIDADSFKPINDNYGHDIGDKVLIELARTLQYSTRTDDIICRVGGDEFFIICPTPALNMASH